MFWIMIPVSDFALRILLNICCFPLGFHIIGLGYRILTSGVKERPKSSTQLIKMRVYLADISLGLIFILLGICLISYSCISNKACPYYTTPQIPDWLRTQLQGGHRPIGVKLRNKCDKNACKYLHFNLAYFGKVSKFPLQQRGEGRI